MLERREPNGTWGGGLYSPKWTSTFYTLRLLTQLGIPPTNREARASTRLLLEQGVSESGGVSLWSGEWTDTCVTGMLLRMACYFGFNNEEHTRRMTTWLLGEQMSDGGWNCGWNRGGATHASFHTTISTLEGFASFASTRLDARIERAMVAGRSFFLKHQLYRSCRTGKIVRSSFAKLSFPPRWYFDVLRGLEHFCEVNAPWDSRLSDAVSVLEARRNRDGRWTAQNNHPGRTFFRLEEARRPSRMNTLRALRVLRWVDAQRGE